MLHLLFWDWLAGSLLQWRWHTAQLHFHLTVIQYQPFVSLLVSWCIVHLSPHWDCYMPLLGLLLLYCWAPCSSLGVNTVRDRGEFPCELHKEQETERQGMLLTFPLVTADSRRAVNTGVFFYEDFWQCHIRFKDACTCSNTSVSLSFSVLFFDSLSSSVVSEKCTVCNC